MKKYNAALLKGDGIGPEISGAAVYVVAAAAKKHGFSVSFTEGLIGGAAIDATGAPLPEETAVLCEACDAVLLAAVGGAKWDKLSKAERPEAGLLGIRSRLGLFANLRPAKTFPGLSGSSPLKEEIIGGGLDVLTVRELCSGIYFGKSGRYTDENGAQAAFDTESYSVPEIERIARRAFSAAQKRRHKLTSVDKANVLESSALWRETVNRISAEFPDVQTDHLYIDNACMQLALNPSRFDVILASNLFGDILSDESAAISGSIGMLPSASLREDSFGLYEPVHGSAPDIAGKGIANPCAMILSAAMMLRYSFDENECADCIEKAVEQSLSRCRTADIKKDGLPVVSTEKAAKTIADFL